MSILSVLFDKYVVFFDIVTNYNLNYNQGIQNKRGITMDTTTKEQTVYTVSGRNNLYAKDISAGWNFGGVNIINEYDAIAEFENGEFETVNIPHTWNTTGTEDCDGRYRRTIYWYIKNLPWESSFENKKNWKDG